MKLPYSTLQVSLDFSDTVGSLRADCVWVGFNSSLRDFWPWGGFQVFSVEFILGKNVLETNSRLLFAFGMEKRWRLKVAPPLSESENLSVLVAKTTYWGLHDLYKHMSLSLTPTAGLCLVALPFY